MQHAPNPHRGEISAQINGQAMNLRLTLGALAELETKLGEEDLLAFAQRLGAGKVRTQDIILILGAALRGGDNAISDEEVAALQPEGGIKGMALLAARAFAAAFGGAEAAPPSGKSRPPVAHQPASHGED